MATTSPYLAQDEWWLCVVYDAPHDDWFAAAVRPRCSPAAKHIGTMQHAHKRAVSINTARAEGKCKLYAFVVSIKREEL
jgi:hypothetical protein